ncbi:hypothetical protein [Photobacterium leiognathi]|uniref:hypothetical protein n=1 Tax=Photobacterium leiognathi TaxID=553611 RepID=UPI002982304A|nr:hypothetical protein [Photobacterium leiognathi]
MLQALDFIKARYPESKYGIIRNKQNPMLFTPFIMIDGWDRVGTNERVHHSRINIRENEVYHFFKNLGFNIHTGKYNQATPQEIRLATENIQKAVRNHNNFNIYKDPVLAPLNSIARYGTNSGDYMISRVFSTPDNELPLQVKVTAIEGIKNHKVFNFNFPTFMLTEPFTSRWDAPNQIIRVINRRSDQLEYVSNYSNNYHTAKLEQELERQGGDILPIPGL